MLVVLALDNGLDQNLSRESRTPLLHHTTVTFQAEMTASVKQ